MKSVGVVKLESINKTYLEIFKERNYPSSDKKTLLAYNNYKSAVQRFDKFIGGKDILTVMPEDIEKYINQNEKQLRTRKVLSEV